MQVDSGFVALVKQTRDARDLLRCDGREASVNEVTAVIMSHVANKARDDLQYEADHFNNEIVGINKHAGLQKRS